MSFNLHGIHNNDDQFIDLIRKLSLFNSRHNSGIDISQVFHCNGLLLCTTKYNRPVVWNPCTGQTRLINPTTCYRKLYRYALGYESNKFCQNYKILRQSRYCTEIYEFSSDSWRVIDDVTHNWDIFSHGMSLKGNTYWLALSKNTTKDNYVFLRSFDFATERYQRLSLPFQNSEPDDTIALSVVREEQLAVLHWSVDTLEIEIWVSTKIETTSVTWKNFFKVGDSSILDCCFLCGVSFFIDDENKKVAVFSDENLDLTGNVVYIIGDQKDEYTKVSLEVTTDFLCRSLMFNYVPSLVRIGSGIVTSADGKRKRL